MERSEQLKFCKQCQNRSFNRNVGIICKLTNAMADFTDTCKDFLLDEEAKSELEEKEKLRNQIQLKEETRGLNALGIKNGIVAGIIIITLAFIWLIIGIAAMERIFIYPFILFGIGGYAIYLGNKRKRDERNG